MGNVQATTSSSSNSPPPPPMGGDPGFAHFSSYDDKFKQREESSLDSLNLLSNPGTIEELHRKCKDVFPNPFDGAKLVVNKMLSNHFQVSHNLVMSGSSQPPGYRFGATYIGTNQLSPSEAYPIFFGEIDPTGNLNSRIIHMLNEKWKVQFGAQIQNSKCAASQFNVDYVGKNFTSSIVLGNVDPLNNSGVAVTSFLQNITPRTSLGAELMCQFSGHNINSALSFSGRYSSPSDFILSGTISKSAVQACYYQKKNEYLQVGVQVETSLTEAESTAQFGYQIDMPSSNFVFRGSVDSNWNIAGVLEKKLTPLPFTLVMSVIMGHSKAQTRAGFGLYVG